MRTRDLEEEKRTSEENANSTSPRMGDDVGALAEKRGSKWDSDKEGSGSPVRIQ